MVHVAAEREREREGTGGRERWDMVNGILDDRRGEGGREGDGDRWADEKERERREISGGLPTLPCRRRMRGSNIQL